MKTIYYEFTPTVEGTVAGIFEVSQKQNARKQLKKEIKGAYKGVQRYAAMKTLKVSEI